ncbi:MAG: rod shape-determining protein RodA [Rickettsiales bacterium]|nr:rod shape-determining protein RodA [Rickettsiales bacterium]
MEILKNTKNFPYIMLIAVYLTAAIGLLLMHGISTPTKPLFHKQMIHLCIASVLLFGAALINIRHIFHISFAIYAVSLILLISVTIVGHTAMGATRWLNLGIVKIQPSELVKIGITMALAAYFHTIQYQNIAKPTTLLIPLAIILIPLIIVIKQPDLGTALTISALSAIILFLAGVKIWKFVVSITTLVISMPIIWHYLYDYQKQRILTFIYPEHDSLGAGYNITQSKIAIGSGGFFGKGYLEGSQTQLNFLPEYQTDFVFSLFAEEFGFFGSIILLLLFFTIILSGINIAIHCKHTFGKLLTYGLVSILSLHIFINIGMVSGLLPVVGIPLPLISYGGSSLTTTFIAVGLMINIKINSHSRLAH